MAIEQGLRTLLLAESTVSTLLGQSTKGVYVGQSPQNAIEPFIEIHVISMDPLKALGGTSGLRFTDLDIDCKARTQPDASALADAVEAYIRDKTGSAGSDTINAVLLNDRPQDIEPPDGSREYGRFVETIDIQAQWTPA